MSLRRPAARLGLIALLVYLPGFWWGAPRAQNDASIRSWGVDDESPIGPLAQIHNIVERAEVQNLGYPLMHSFMAGAVYAPYLAAKWVSGDFRSPSGTYPYGLANPIRTLQVLTWLAHLLSVVLGAGIVVAAALTAERLWGAREAWWAGAFTLVSYPMFYYARTGNVDVPALFFIAAALVPFAGILKEGLDIRRAAWLGVWAGFAVATKETSAAAFIGIPPVLIWLAWTRRAEEGVDWAAFGRQAGVGLVAAFLAFGIGSGLFVDPDRYFAHLEFARGRIQALRQGGVAFVSDYPRTLAGHLALTRLLGGYVLDAVTIPGLLLAGVGIASAIRRRHPGAWLIVPFLTYMFVLFWSARAGLLRYVMPATLVLGPFAAHGFVTLREGGRGAPGRVLRWAAAAAAGWIVIVGAMRGADLTYQMIRDSRWPATAWLEARYGEGDRLDFFGPDAKLPWLPLGITFDRANEYLGAIYPPKRGPEDAERIRERWRTLRPDVILVMPDVSSREGEPHNATLPPEVFRELESGALGYRRAALFRTPSLFPWLPTPELDYPSVNPPIRVYVPEDAGREPAS